MKRYLHFIGSFLAVVAVIYVLYELTQYQHQIDFSRFNIGNWILIAFLIITYGFGNLLLAFSWREILAKLSQPLTLSRTIRIYGLSQLAKYLPGNVFHIAGRQALGMAQGIGASTLLKSTIWELTLIALVGSFFGVLVLPIIFGTFTSELSISLFLAVLSLGVWSTYSFFGPNILLSYIYYLLFLFLSGLIFLVLLSIVSGDFQSNSLFIVAAFVIAWLIGLITPGAPAGIGVREFVLLFLLKGIISEADILLAVIMGRLVTVLGDLIFYLFSISLYKVCVRD